MTQSPPRDLEDELSALFGCNLDLLSDPYPLYARLRAEAPVTHWNSVVVVSRHVDVLRVLRDPQTFSAQRGTGSRVARRKAELTPEQATRMQEIVDHESLWLPQTDDPQHKRLRGLASQAFTRRRVAEMRATVEQLVTDLLTPARERGALEFVREAAYPLPLLVVAGMLGASPEDAERIREWSDQIALSVGTTYANVDEAHAALQSFKAYVVELINERRGGGRTDLFAALVNAEEHGERLSTDELIAMFVLLLFAGHETTTNLMTNAVVALLRNPDQLDVLRSDPSLVAPATEEFLRYCNSVHAIHRVATTDTVVGDVPVLAGTTVRLMLGAANHDEAVFADSERLDVRRTDVSRQVGLGFGIHTCLGAWLLRLETEVLVRALLDLPTIEQTEPEVMRPNFLLSGPAALHLTVR
jgi:cytochrome P450